MQRTRAIQLVAFFLLFVFIQKMGAGLYLHQWLHVQKCDTASADPASAKFTSYSCTCIDSFAVPFTDVNIAGYSSPIRLFFPTNFPVINESASGQPALFSSLRGPPEFQS